MNSSATAFLAAAGILVSGAFVFANEGRGGASLPQSNQTDRTATNPADEPGYTVSGEQLDASLLGPGVVESMEVVIARDEALRAAGTPPAVHPQRPRPRPFSNPNSTAPSSTTGGSGTSFVITPPTLVQNFSGPNEGDPGANAIPPDTCGMVGLNHFVSITNSNLSAFRKSDGVRVMNVSLNSFFNNGNAGGDPRVCFDTNAQRWFATSDNFATNSTIFLAASTTSDPTGTWFKTSFVASAGTDAGHFADYPTLGVDTNGVYIAAYMVHTPATMTIWAINKAPLIAPAPSLGTITAFRGLPYESAIQPCVTWGNPGVEYLVSDQSSTAMRVRRVNPPLTAPTLTNVGSVSVPSHGGPPSAPQSGGAPTLDTLDSRHINAVYRNGFIWAIQGVIFAGRASERWFQVNASTLALTQNGLINDPTLYLFDGSISPNSNNDVVIGFSASNNSTFGGGYYCGRTATDPAGQVSAIQVLKAGQAHYDPGAGDPTRWGDYSLTSCDPVDDTFWTIQEYARPGNNWGTWIGHLGNPCVGGPDCNGNGIRDSCDITSGTSLDNNGDLIPDECEGFNGMVFCAGDGLDPLITSLCPCFNFGTPGNGCGNSIDAAGASMRASGVTSPTDNLSFNVTHLPPAANVVFVKGNASNVSGAVFGDGVRCVAGAQIRFGTGAAVAGAITYPDLAQPSISSVGGTPPGSGLTAYYQCFYRNPDPLYCTPATFNISNGFQITW